MNIIFTKTKFLSIMGYFFQLQQDGITKKRERWFEIKKRTNKAVIWNQKENKQSGDFESERE